LSYPYFFVSAYPTQLPPDDRSRTVPRNVIIPNGWDEKKISSANFIKDTVVKNLVDALHDQDDEGDGEPDEDYDPYYDDIAVFTAAMKPKAIASDLQIFNDFVDQLPGCLPLTLGFQLPPGFVGDRSNWCFCPCSKGMKDWRQASQLSIDPSNCSKTHSFMADGFKQHLAFKRGDCHHLLIYSYLERLSVEILPTESGGSPLPLLDAAFSNSAPGPNRPGNCRRR
jgi:hypothetical protein